MGPELKSSGKLNVRVRLDALLESLQWGRSSKAPENTEPSDGNLSVTGLQWGRSSKAPENEKKQYVIIPRRKASMGPELKSSGKRIPGGISRCQIERFNGAGAQKLRKTYLQTSGLSAHSTASMGPELKSSGKLAAIPRLRLAA